MLPWGHCCLPAIGVFLDTLKILRFILSTIASFSAFAFASISVRFPCEYLCSLEPPCDSLRTRRHVFPLLSIFHISFPGLAMASQANGVMARKSVVVDRKFDEALSMSSRSISNSPMDSTRSLIPRLTPKPVVRLFLSFFVSFSFFLSLRRSSNAAVGYELGLRSSIERRGLLPRERRK